MLYHFVKPIAKISMYVFCRHIYLNNLEVLKKDRPTLIACNHPTAFFDPCLVASVAKPTIHFVVRGDFFKHPFYRKLLFGLNLIPIHRSKHASFQQLKSNFDLMADMVDKLQENINLMVMVEGSGSINRQLRPLQKGIARLAFQTYEKYGRSDLEIIPMGVNFDDPTQYRLTPYLAFGKPLLLSDYLEIYQQNKNKAIRLLMADLEKAMKVHIIHLDDLANERLYNDLFQLLQNQNPKSLFPIYRKTRTELNQYIKLAQQLNDSSTEKIAQLQQTLTAYQHQLEDQKLTDKALTISKSPISLFLLLLLTPFALIGMVVNFLPLWIGHRIAKQKVKKIQYFIPVAWAGSLILYLLYFLLLLTAALISGQKWGTLLVLSMPLLVYLSVVFWQELGEWHSLSKRWQLTKEQANAMKEQRANVLGLLESVGINAPE